MTEVGIKDDLAVAFTLKQPVMGLKILNLVFYALAAMTDNFFVKVLLLPLLEYIPYIYYPMRFKKDQANV